MEENEKKSKSRIKKEMHDLQNLGKTLAELADVQIDDMPMPDALKEALHFFKTIPSFGARNRQIQYIGALMREVDTAPILEALTRLKSGHRIDVETFHEAERLRDALVSGDQEAYEAALKRFSDLDRQHVNQLIRNAGKEARANKPPKAAKALFRYLKERIDRDASEKPLDEHPERINDNAQEPPDDHTDF